MTQAQHPFEKGLISVIAGNYNTPVRFVKKAIDSVLKQTYQNFEFIIVDDCSTDDSLETIKSYDDPRIKIMSTDKNSGLATALNKALDVCRGEYVARMDLDDICLPERFERQLAYMREHPDVIVCGTYIKQIDGNGDICGDDRSFKSFDDMERYRIFQLFANSPAISHPSAMFNRGLLEKHHIRYHENYLYAQDYRMWISCARWGKCCTMPEVLLKYRIHGQAISTEKKEQQDDCFFMIVQEQLDALHLTLKDELKPLHRAYLQELKPFDMRLFFWILSIIRANRKYNVYSQKKLRNLLLHRWLWICKCNLLLRGSLEEKRMQVDRQSERK